MNTWELGLLLIIYKRGGAANTKSIYSDLENGKHFKLTKDDLRSTEYGGRPAYQHQVRSHLSNLTEAGDLFRIMRGTYKITRKGLERIGIRTS